MEKYIKKDLNYEIPPIGPIIHVYYLNNIEQNSRLFLNYVIDRVKELEYSNKPISYMEYNDISSFLFNSFKYVTQEKDTEEHYFYDELIHTTYNKINNLYETRKIYVDIPQELLTIILDNLYLTINYERSVIRHSIKNILEYLSNNTNISDDVIIKIKEYIDKVLELEIFKRDDLMIFFPDNWKTILF